MDNTAHRHSISVGNNNVNCNNVTNSHNNTANNILADENPEIMKWLSPLDPGERHHDVRTDRIDGVGNWPLERREFRSGGVIKVGRIRLYYFVVGIREWGKHI